MHLSFNVLCPYSLKTSLMCPTIVTSVCKLCNLSMSNHCFKLLQHTGIKFLWGVLYFQYMYFKHFRYPMKNGNVLPVMNSKPVYFYITLINIPA